MTTDRHLPQAYDVLAPDGSEVRILACTERGSMAHFTLSSGQTSLAVTHHSVEEIWYIVSGAGQMWRKVGMDETVTDLAAGLSLTIPVGCHFQFRCNGEEALKAVAVTMPPWPGMEEAYLVKGKW
jgi:mannose-6-phosphate isomerase-like protein (cupin superfamily)